MPDARTWAAAALLTAALTVAAAAGKAPAAEGEALVAKKPAAAAAETCPSLSTVAAVAAKDAAPALGDSRLAAARAYVEASDRYLHHSRLTRGMRGYGLTVLEGVAISRFEVEIVAIEAGHLPGRDVILARVRGCDLDKSGVIAGMSGSPIFIDDAGSPRLVGALAYGYSYQTPLKFGPLCGIQPITQMLAAAGVGSESDPLASPLAAGPTLDAADFAAALAITDGAAFERHLCAMAARRGVEAARGELPMAFGLPTSSGRRARLAGALTTRGAALSVASASAKAAAPASAAPPRLEPGASLVVPMTTGDVNYTAIGTVTDCVEGRVLGFGHPLFGRGRVEFPVGTGVIHTVVSNIQTSYKTGALVEVTGALRGDDYAAVVAVEGEPPAMIPMRLRVERPAAAAVQDYRVNLVDDYDWTWLLASFTIYDCLDAIADLPRFSRVEYELEIDFDGFESVRIANVSSVDDDYALVYDLERWLWTMMNNPFAVARPTAIRAALRVLPGERAAEIVSLASRRRSYRPGDAVTLTATLRDYYEQRSTRQLELRLPDILPEGEYTIELGGADAELDRLRRRRPLRFQPRSLAEVHRMLRLESDLRRDRLYLSMDTGRPELTIEDRTVADLPATVGDMLAAAELEDVSDAASRVAAQWPADLEIVGEASVTITVRTGILPN